MSWKIIVFIMISYTGFGQYSTLTCNSHPFEFYNVGCNELIDISSDVTSVFADANCMNAYFEAANISEIEIVNDGGQQEPTGTTISNTILPSTVVPMDSVVRGYFDTGLIVDTKELLGYMQSVPYYQQNVFNLNWGSYFDILVVYRVDYANLQGAGNGNPSWTEDDAIVRIRYRITHANNIKLVNGFTTLCAGKTYALNDIFQPLPSIYTNYSFDSNVSYNFNSAFDSITFDYNVPQQVEISMTAENVLGLSVCKTWELNMDNVYDAWFTDVVQSSGQVLSSDAAVFMYNYIDSTGGVMEYSGPGIVTNGNITMFDPSFATSGANQIYVRSNNNGCKSDWNDTMFFVTPVVSTFDKPVWDIPYTFNGDFGGNLTKKVSGVVEEIGKYHMGCSNSSYSFKPTNHVLGLELEYKVLWKNQIILTGTAGYDETIDLIMPDSIDLNLSSSIYDLSALFNPGASNVTYDLLLTTSGGDLNNNGMSDSDDLVYGVNLADEYRLIGRYVNVSNVYSDYTTLVVGLVDTPTKTENSLLCFDNNPIMNAVTNTPVYFDSIDSYIYRSAVWDVDMDGIYDIDGSVDNYVHLITNVVKEYTMVSGIIDSTYLWMYSPFLNEYMPIYKSGISTECYSSYDTVSVVRNPIPSYTFNLQGVQGVGTAIYSDVVGDWMDLVSDSITWDWSDGSLLYEGASNWHFLNDLGNYTLTARVEDGYGCYTTNLFYNNWFVPGVLELDENNQEYLEIYPIPVVDELTIKGFRGGEVVTIYDSYGKVVYVGVDHIINMSMFSSGVYVIHIENDGLIVKRKIVKL